MKTHLILGLFVVVAISTPSCTTSEGKSNGLRSNTERIPVKLLPLVKQETSAPIEASGTFTTNDETYLSFKTGGVIERVFKQEGDQIRKGELLATLNLTEINTQVAQAELGFAKAKRDFERVSNLYKDSVATLEQFQNSRTALDVAAKTLEAASFNRAYSEIRALRDGYVLKKLADAGQVVSTGTPVYETNGAKSNNWKLDVAVSDEMWAKISKGDKAKIQTDANNKIYSANVTRKSESIDPYTGSFSVELTISDSRDAKLATGMFGKAIIYVAKKEATWMLPYESVLDGEGNTAFVFATKDNQTVRLVNVKIASITPDSILINDGLEGYSAIVTMGSAYLKDGSQIESIK